MTRLFPSWSDTALRIALVGFLVTVATIVIAPMVYVRTPYNLDMFFPVDQPVQFDHRHHVQDDNIDCRYCHSSVTRSAYAGVPPTDLCMGCHNQIWNQSPMIEPLRRSYFSGLPMPWNRVHNLPDFVYFNHAIHVNKGVGCVTCHGRVDQMPLAYQVSPLTMGWCLECHRAPEKNLRPLSAITSMTWQPPADPKERDALARQLASELGVRRLTNCTACHR